MIKTCCDMCDKAIADSQLLEIHKNSLVTGGVKEFHFCSWGCLEKYAKNKKKAENPNAK